jgi:hypothetical protein
MRAPSTSDGIRSGVHWMRAKSSSSASASVRANVVLPTPGAPSISTWTAGEERREQLLDRTFLAQEALAQRLAEPCTTGAQALDLALEIAHAASLRTRSSSPARSRARATPSCAWTSA